MAYRPTVSNPVTMGTHGVINEGVASGASIVGNWVNLTTVGMFDYEEYTPAAEAKRVASATFGDGAAGSRASDSGRVGSAILSGVRNSSRDL